MLTPAGIFIFALDFRSIMPKRVKLAGHTGTYAQQGFLPRNTAATDFNIVPRVAGADGFWRHANRGDLVL